MIATAVTRKTRAWRVLLASILPLLLAYGCGTEVGNGRRGDDPINPKNHEGAVNNAMTPAVMSDAADVTDVMFSFPSLILFAECGSPFGQGFVDGFILRERFSKHVLGDGLKLSIVGGKYRISSLANIGLRDVEAKDNFQILNYTLAGARQDPQITCAAASQTIDSTLPGSAMVAKQTDVTINYDHITYRLRWYVTGSAGDRQLRRIDVVNEGAGTRAVLIQP